MMNHNQLIKQAEAAIQKGGKQQARSLLRAALRQNPQSHAAWLWLASIASSSEVSLDYVRRAEMLQPGHTAVLKACAWAERQLKIHQAQTTGHTTPQ